MTGSCLPWLLTPFLFSRLCSDTTGFDDGNAEHQMKLCVFIQFTRSSKMVQKSLLSLNPNWQISFPNRWLWTRALSKTSRRLDPNKLNVVYERLRSMIKKRVGFCLCLVLCTRSTLLLKVEDSDEETIDPSRFVSKSEECLQVKYSSLCSPPFHSNRSHLRIVSP